jgi:hypothetical protein
LVVNFANRKNAPFLFSTRIGTPPVRHTHFVVEGRRGREMASRLLTLACVSVELAEAEVAVGDEGAHAKFLGSGPCALVVPVRPFNVAHRIDR